MKPEKVFVTNSNGIPISLIYLAYIKLTDFTKESSSIHNE